MSDDSDSPSLAKLTLEQFLKIQGWVDSGGQAKIAIQGGEVRVNGQVDTRRRRQLAIGDRVEFHGQAAVVATL
jgi:ribosome-associated protein